MVDSIGEMLAVGRFLGLDDSPMDEIKDVMTVARTKQSMQLEREKAQWDRTHDGAKLVFGLMEKALSNSALSEAHREWLLNLSDSYKSSLPKELRAGFEALPGLRFLSEEGQREREFDRRFERPKDPVGADGLPLPLTAENEPIIAKTRLAQMEHDYKKVISIFGPEKGKEMMKLPKFISVLPGAQAGQGTPKVGAKAAEGASGYVPGVGTGQETSQNLWFIDPDTRQVQSVNLGVLGVDLKQAQEWGYSLLDMAKSGAAPIAPPQIMTIDGESARITPMKALMGGKEFVDKINYGKPDSAYSGIPDDVNLALSYVGFGVTDPDSAKTKFGSAAMNPKALEIAQLFGTLEEAFKGAKGDKNKQLAVTTQIQQIDSFLKSRYPEQMKNYRLVQLDPNLPKEGILKYIGFGGLALEGMHFGFIKADRIIRVTGDDGPEINLHQDSETGQAYDDNGTKVNSPTSEPIKDGDVVPGIRLKPKVQAGKSGQPTVVAEAAPEFVMAGIGKAVSMLLDDLSIMGGQIGRGLKAVGSLDVSGEYDPEKAKGKQKTTLEKNREARAELGENIEQVRQRLATTAAEVTELLASLGANFTENMAAGGEALDIMSADADEALAMIATAIQEARARYATDKTAVEILDDLLEKIVNTRDGIPIPSAKYYESRRDRKLTETFGKLSQKPKITAEKLKRDLER